jgi:hypothetical protein
MPVTDRDLQLLDMPLIADQLPVVLDNGATWSELKVFCRGCNEAIYQGNFVGSVSTYQGRMAVIEAVGICEPCHLLTRYLYRLHDDLHVSAPGKDGWETWYQGTAETPSLRQRWARIASRLARFFRV